MGIFESLTLEEIGEKILKLLSKNKVKVTDGLDLLISLTVTISELYFKGTPEENKEQIMHAVSEIYDMKIKEMKKR